MTDICKIIECKSITSGRDVNHSVLLPKFAPDLDKDLAENLCYCLYCDYCDEEAIKVILHCVHKHRDYEVCAYNKERPQTYSLEESDSDISESDEIESDSNDEPKQLPINKNLVNSFQNKLSFESEAIPGIEDNPNGTYIAPQTSRPPNRAPRQKYHKKCLNRFENKFEKKSVKRKESFDSYFEDDYEVGFPSYDTTNEENIPAVSHSYVEPTVQPENVFICSPVDQSVPPPPIASTSHQSTELSSTSSRHQNVRKKLFKPKKNKNLKLKSNEKLSEMTYGEYRKQRALLKPVLTSTPISNGAPPAISSEIPPEIDLQQTEKELGLDSNEGIRKNSFKQINRVGAPSHKSNKSSVTYIQRTEEEEDDEYLQLLNQKIPKRGVKARFENHSHFELISLQSTNSQTTGNLYKCLICPNEIKLRENQINNHLKSVHNTDSSFKCGYCSYIGQKGSIRSHSKLSHPSSEDKIEKFIVNAIHDKAIGFTSGTHLEKSKTTARKSTGGVAQVAKGGKGFLTQRIRESVYMGPLSNDVTERKQTDSRQPFQRVYSRSTHSSNIRPKKRQKLNTSDSDFEAEMETQFNIESDDEQRSDIEMNSDYEQVVQHYQSDDSDMEVVTAPAPKGVAVAKKSTAKPSSQESSQVTITLNEEQIPTKYFCAFCADSYIINDKMEAIEHYKQHLNLGYTCGQCHQFFGSYSSMESHWTEVHPYESDMDFEDNMTDFIRKWIVTFLDNQITCSDFAESIVPNSTGINIRCPLCEKASMICQMRPRAFDSLWKAKLHICKHLNWFPMKCALCEDPNILFPQNPYLLMKHLIDCHFTSCENLYNISFRGQKPFNDMKKEQLRIIEKNFFNIRVFSCDIINSFFFQLMTELDFEYENQLRAKYKLNKELQVNVERLIQVKTEPEDDEWFVVEVDESQPELESEPKPEVKEEDIKDKKDIKLLIKTEIKPEIKSEMKTETKEETKDQLNTQLNGEQDNDDSGDQFFSRLYGDDAIESNPIPSLSFRRPTTSSKEAIEIVISSSDEEC